MIEEARGRIDYDAYGVGPTVVLVPGSCSTGAAWRPIINQWDGRFRCVTTSLLGYGGTSERRTSEDPSITRLGDHEAGQRHPVAERDAHRDQTAERMSDQMHPGARAANDGLDDLHLVKRASIGTIGRSGT